jgi:prolyl oligopeptidase
MPSREWRRRVAALTVLVVPMLGVAGGPDWEYPAARTMDVVEPYRYSDTMDVPDPYRWLEDGADAEVQAWVRAQNALTRQTLDRFEETRVALRRELDALFAEHIASVPVLRGGRRFFTRRVGLQDQPVLYVQDGDEAEPRVVIDPNALSDDGTVALDWWFPSPDGQLVAYGTSAGGTENSTLYVRDTDTNTNLPVEIPRTRHATVAWEPDGAGFFYTRYPTPGDVPAGDEQYYRRVFYHRLAEDAPSGVSDRLVWGGDRPKEEWVNITTAGDAQVQFLATSLDWTRNDLYVRRAGADAFRPVAVGLDATFEGHVVGDRVLLRTDYEAPRYRVVAAPLDAPTPENWAEVIPQQQGILDALTVVDGKLVVRVMENAYARLLIYAPDGTLIKEVELPTLGTVDEIEGQPGQRDLYFRFESFVVPPAVYHYDMREHTLRVQEQLAVGARLDELETRQVWFNSKDGTRVPMFVTHRKGLELDGSHPTVLWGYGGFNISMTPTFYRAAIPWLERGGIWAVANIRGGGEFGKAWHMAGRLEQKQNTFDDFSAAAEKLIADGYTSSAHLGARGGSNGGLLVGAMIVQRPELFAAICCEVPLLDMLRYHHFEVARLWIPEYGCAEDPEQFQFLYAYSPYHHVEDGTAYPAVMLRTAEGDSRVDPMHARKMAARLQAATASDAPILLWSELKSGHGAGQPLSMYIERQVDIWTFFMWQLGMLDQPTTQPATRPAGEA